MITQDKEAYNQARELFEKRIAENRLAPLMPEILFSFPNLFIIADMKGQIVFANKNWLDLFAFSLSEIIGKPFVRFVAPEDVERTLNQYNEIKEDHNMAKAFRNSYLKKDGSRVLLEWDSNTPVNESYIIAIARPVND